VFFRAWFGLLEAAAGLSLRREERAQGALQRGDPVGVAYPGRGLRHDRPFADHALQHGPVQMHPLLGPVARAAADGRGAARALYRGQGAGQARDTPMRPRYADVQFMMLAGPIACGQGRCLVTPCLQGLFGPPFLGIVGIVAIFFLFTREITRFVQFMVLAVAIAVVFYTPSIVQTLVARTA
jgi:hypothetical protein